MSSKHTPGPWKAHKPERQFDPDSDVYEIHWSDIGECVAEIVHGEANAYLFAAAPELLEALRNLIEFRDTKRDITDNIHSVIAALDQLYAEARAAVEKARGGTEHG